MQSGVSRRAIEQTEARIRPHLRVTPVLQTEAAGFGGPPVALTLKLELLQHAGSFKARGAFGAKCKTAQEPSGKPDGAARYQLPLRKRSHRRDSFVSLKTTFIR